MTFIPSKLSAGTKPVAYVVSLGDNKLVTGDSGKSVSLSAEPAAEHLIFVPDNSAGTGTTRYIIASANKTFLAKSTDSDHISTSTKRADALRFEILQDANGGGAYKLVSDGLVLTGLADGKVELQPDSEANAERWQFKLTPPEAAGNKGEQGFIFDDSD